MATTDEVAAADEATAEEVAAADDAADETADEDPELEPPTVKSTHDS